MHCRYGTNNSDLGITYRQTQFTGDNVNNVDTLVSEWLDLMEVR